jgi:hypothetical protein
MAAGGTVVSSDRKFVRPPCSGMKFMAKSQEEDVIRDVA